MVAKIVTYRVFWRAVHGSGRRGVGWREGRFFLEIPMDGCRGVLKIAAARRFCVSGLCLLFASAPASAIPGVGLFLVGRRLRR